MNVCRQITYALGAILLAYNCAFAEELGVKATANRSQIYIGESFILEVTVSGSVGPAELDFSGVTNATIRSLGTRNVSNYSITIINGRMTKEGFTGFVASYEITPHASGRFKAGPVAVKINGKVFADDGPVVVITDIEKQDRVLVSVSASRETALIDEPFFVTLSVKIRCMEGEIAKFDPVFPDNPPHLSIPWLDEEMEGLIVPDVRQMLTGYLAPNWNQPGITINKFTLSSDPFDIGSMFLREPRRAKFALPRNSVQINGRLYYEYKLRFDYTPKDEGNYVFGPVIFKGGVPERLDEHGQASGPNVFAVGPACTVRIIPPPDENRPESYSGAIGSNLTVKAALDTAICNVGDPLKLTLTVSGQVKLDKMLPPRLSLQTNILNHFTVYDNTVQAEKKDSYNQYTYTIRPTQAGNCQVPPLEVAYYDVISRGYKKVRTSPISLRVRAGAEVTEAQVIGNTNQLLTQKEEMDVRKQIPAFVRLDQAGAAPARLWGDSRVLGVAAAGPAFYFLIAFFGFIGRAGRKIRRARHRQSAKKRAFIRLKRAERIGKKDPQQAFGIISDALRIYLGERLERDAASFTPSEAVDFLTENGVRRESAEQYGAMYEKYFNAGFANAGLPSSLSDDCRDFRVLIRRIEMELGQKQKDLFNRRDAEAAENEILRS